ncbi:hypothetical protein F4780DRAFT_104913 [Xylariomycetidae sp. FL0641]|nr:hypothetical protein F4780DRAFT_104913 [Xylariomycetidae sp. FL0641]
MGKLVCPGVFFASRLRLPTSPSVAHSCFVFRPANAFLNPGHVLAMAGTTATTTRDSWHPAPLLSRKWYPHTHSVAQVKLGVVRGIGTSAPMRSYLAHVVLMLMNRSVVGSYYFVVFAAAYPTKLAVRQIVFARFHRLRHGIPTVPSRRMY